MARLLNATSYWSSVLAAVCLVLALVAAPIGEARADDPPPGGGGDAALPVCAPDVTTCGTNTGTPENDCLRITCNTDSRCKCLWRPAGQQSVYACRCTVVALDEPGS